MAPDPTIKAGDLVQYTDARGVTTLVTYKRWALLTKTDTATVTPEAKS